MSQTTHTKAYEIAQEVKKAERELSLKNQVAFSEKKNILVPEIKRLWNILKEEGFDNTDPSWRYTRKAEKVDEVIERYNITLDGEIRAINNSYDLRCEKLRTECEKKIYDLEKKIESLRRGLETDLELQEKERERSLESKKREYEKYIEKREREKNEILQDKKSYLENRPQKANKTKRLFDEKLEEWNNVIKAYNREEKNPLFHAKRNYGCEFLEEKTETKPETSEKKSTFITPPHATGGEGGKKVEKFLENSGIVSENQIPEIKKVEVKKEIDKEYLAFREKYKRIHGEELPEEPEELPEEKEQIAEYTEPKYLPVIQNTKEKKKPRVVAK